MFVLIWISARNFVSISRAFYLNCSNTPNYSGQRHNKHTRIQTIQTLCICIVHIRYVECTMAYPRPTLCIQLSHIYDILIHYIYTELSLQTRKSETFLRKSSCICPINEPWTNSYKVCLWEFMQHEETLLSQTCIILLVRTNIYLYVFGHFSDLVINMIISSNTICNMLHDAIRFVWTYGRIVLC